MRTPALLVLALSVLFLPQSADARCGMRGTWVFPAAGTEIPAEPRIAVTGYGIDEGWIRDLADHAPELVSGDDRVPLAVVETYEGEMRLTRAILVPERALVAGRTYVLEVLRNGERRAFPALPHGGRVARWRVVSRTNPLPVWWRAPPEVSRSEYQRFGCGPASHVHVAVPLAGGSGPVAVRVTVRNLDDGAEAPVRYEVEVEEGEVRIGHGMCQGAFRLRPGVRYSVELEAVDQTGERVPAPGGPLEIAGPSSMPSR